MALAQLNQSKAERKILYFLPLCGIHMAHDEKILLERKAVMEKRYKKIPGTFIVTEEKILFQPLFRRGEITIPLKNISDIGIKKYLRKKLRIVKGENEYIFLMKGVNNVYRLLSSLLPNIYKNSSNTIT